jgi:hypothetical protein
LKRKRIYYEIEAKHLWWQAHFKRWFTSEESNKPEYDNYYFGNKALAKTLKKAIKIGDKAPLDVLVTIYGYCKIKGMVEVRERKIPANKIRRRGV